MADDVQKLPVTPEDPVSLEKIPQLIWSLLGEAVTDKGHPFRTPVIATSNKHGPEARIVVLRRIDAERRHLECHTDVRSGKISQLTGDDAIAWVFYDAAQKIQVRARGVARIYNQDEYSHTRWTAISEHQKREYAQALPPGKKIGQEAAHYRRQSDADPESGRGNFAVISSCIHELEWLQLAREGHRRALMVFADQRWSAQWLMP
ncbi:MAG: hypothetical protein HKN70_05860 [Gammaproteobacteria bacterium]|nr:hypothetical protein [Gammaproteobacteria bacterium]